MTGYRIERPPARPAVHPGEVLREDVLPALGLSIGGAARRLGVSRRHLHRILSCTHPVSAEMALRIGRLVGNGPGLWLRMQRNHDLRRAGRKLKDGPEGMTPAT